MLAGPSLAGKGDGERSVAEFEVTEPQALEIAKARGLAALRQVTALRGVWKFEGAYADGAVIETEIDGVTGEAVKVERCGMPAQGN